MSWGTVLWSISSAMSCRDRTYLPLRAVVVGRAYRL